MRKCTTPAPNKGAQQLRAQATTLALAIRADIESDEQMLQRLRLRLLRLLWRAWQMERRPALERRQS